MIKTVTLAHYYTTPEVQQLADRVGDSLDLSLYAQTCQAELIVFAGVRFMAETAKILNPQARVILPDLGSTCSLVTMTDITRLKKWRAKYKDHVHVAYINSSAEHKTIADWIVTSRNVDDIIAHIYNQGKQVIYSPDRNMGAYLNSQYDYNMPLWEAVCEVHDQFSQEELTKLYKNIAGSKYLIAHPESPLPILAKSDYIGSTSQLLTWIKNYTNNLDAVIFVATESGILYNMKTARPELDIRQAPIYKGCQCNSCPYMKLNTQQAVIDAQNQRGGVEINYLNQSTIAAAKIPIMRMLEFSRQHYN